MSNSVCGVDGKAIRRLCHRVGRDPRERGSLPRPGSRIALEVGRPPLALLGVFGIFSCQPPGNVSGQTLAATAGGHHPQIHDYDEEDTSPARRKKERLSKEATGNSIVLLFSPPRLYQN